MKHLDIVDAERDIHDILNGLLDGLSLSRSAELQTLADLAVHASLQPGVPEQVG